LNATPLVFELGDTVMESPQGGVPSPVAERGHDSVTGVAGVEARVLGMRQGRPGCVAWGSPANLGEEKARGSGPGFGAEGSRCG
jgi:hypothetical protein